MKGRRGVQWKEFSNDKFGKLVDWAKRIGLPDKPGPEADNPKLPDGIDESDAQKAIDILKDQDGEKNSVEIAFRIARMAQAILRARKR